MTKAPTIISAISELASARDLQTVMDVVRLSARELTGADGVTFVLRDGDKCFYAEENAISPLWKGKRFPMSICISGWVMLNKSEVIIPDIFGDDRIPADAYRPTFVKSLAMVPVRRTDPVAAIGAYWASNHEATQQEMGVLNNLADAASVAMTNVHMYGALQSRAEEYEKLFRKAQEDTIQHIEIEERYRNIFEHAATGIAISDWGSSVQQCNPAFCAMTGYSEDELKSTSLSVLIYPQDFEENLQAFENLKSGGCESYELQTRYLKKKGGFIWVYKYVSILPGRRNEDAKLLELVTDITEIRNTQERLLNSQRHLEFALAGGELGTWEWEIATGESVINDRWGQMLGYEPGELKQHYETFANLLHPDDSKRVIKELKDHLENDGEFNSEFRLRGKEGEYHWILGRGKVLDRDEYGRPLKMFGITQDITTQRSLEERVRQMEKMDAIGQLAGGVAHDFNNQLTGILGYADLLKYETDADRHAQYIQCIVNAAKRASDLTRQLLTFSRKAQCQYVETDMHEIIKEVITILEHTIDKRIEISQYLRAEIPLVTGDPSLLQNALLNLAINARDAMPDGGAMTFETSCETLDEDYCNTVPYEISPGDYLKVCFSDTGCGITPENVKRVFEPFFTTKEPGKGTGMGLAAVYGTVKHHNGAINVYSEPGHGTTFRIYLPLSRKSSGKINSENESRNHSIKGLNIFVIEDEDSIRNMIVAMLEGEGCHVLTAANGEEALSIYQQKWQEIDVVLFDMIMPKMDGKDTFRAMKSINNNIRAVLSSGYSVNGAASKIMNEGVGVFIQKPFTRAQLTESIASVVND